NERRRPPEEAGVDASAAVARTPAGSARHSEIVVVVEVVVVIVVLVLIFVVEVVVVVELVVLEFFVFELLLVVLELFVVELLIVETLIDVVVVVVADVVVGVAVVAPVFVPLALELIVIITTGVQRQHFVVPVERRGADVGQEQGLFGTGGSYEHGGESFTWRVGSGWGSLLRASI